MNGHGIGLLLAAIIEQAVHDRRLAVTHHLIDAECRPLRPFRGKRKDRLEITMSLREFFYCGGLEVISSEAGFNLPIQKIKEKSNEPFKRRERK